MGFYRTDGKAIKSLDIVDVFGTGVDLVTDATPRASYTAVPFVRRAVRLRANAVAGVPITLQRGTRDISARPEFEALMQMLPSLIWRTEFALCLSTSGAYWRRGANPAGLNPTPEWLLPQACWPFITAERGLEYIRYVRPWGVIGAGHIDQLAPEAVVTFWLPSLDRANWPGSPPGETASAAASALSNRDAFVADYFKRGAVKGVLLTVPPTTQQAEREKLKSWWQQVVAGVKNAWKSNVISADVKPIIIGEGLAETNADSLTNQYRQDIAAAFEVPESMLLSNAANFATAREERIGFYEETVFPALALILAAINQQWLQGAYDAELVAHPEQTEPRQDAQVQQSQAITELVGQPVLTIDEGRAWLGLEPMPQTAPMPTTEATDYSAMEAEASADDTAEQQAEQPSAKALRAADGRYTLLPGTETRTLERGHLLSAHAAQRATTRTRHADERRQARERHGQARASATDAGARLRLVHHQRAELATLSDRHAAERSMLRSLHAAERGRLRDRHAAQRTLEHAGPVEEHIS